MPKKVSKKVVKKVVAKKVKVVKKAAKPKKAAVKKVKAKVAKKAAKPAKAGKTPAKTLVISKPLNRSQIIRHLAEASGIQKKDVVSVMDTLVNLIESHLKKRGPGEFTLLGLAKFRVIHKSATKARQGVNPFTGESIVFAAKPARHVVKIKPLKRVKEMVD